jgi:hypothetical protein
MPQCQFLFYDVFLFQISIEGNILRIGRNKSQSSYFSDMKTESKWRQRRAGRRSQHAMARAHPWSRRCGPLGRPPTSPFRLYIVPDAKTLNKEASIHKKFRGTAAIEYKFRGTEISVLAPCRDGELPPVLEYITS